MLSEGRKDKDSLCKSGCRTFTKSRSFQKMQTTRTLPVKDISSGKDISVKILERHRKYIIVAAEIMQGDYPLLKEYMSYIRKALESEL